MHRQIVVALASCILALPAGAQSAHLRVNQVGYAAGAPKRAYLMASGPETGATFHVKNAAGKVVFSAAIGARLGSWGNFPDVYPIDFDALSAAGSYTISVASPIAAV